MDIGIIGVGMVGGTLKGWFKDAKTYDKFKPSDTLAEVLNQEVIFLCLNLLDDGLGEGEFETIAELLKACPPRKIIVNKMTTYPGFTRKLAEAFPLLTFFHNPEFLTEARAEWDFSHPPFQLLGTLGNSLLARDILNLLPPSPVAEVLEAEETELFKLVRNSLLATKVVLANQIYDICQSHDIDYETLRHLFKADVWIGDGHTDIFHNGYRGYGGKCLPKDIQSLIKWQPGTIFEKVEEINKNYD